MDVRRYRFDNINGGGTLIFGSIFSSSTDSAGSGAPLADFLMGYPSNTDGKQLLDWARQRDLYVGSYFQDDWKISPRLTINFGIRYDLYRNRWTHAIAAACSTSPTDTWRCRDRTASRGPL